MTRITNASVLIDTAKLAPIRSQHTGYPKKGKGWKALFAGVVIVVGAVILGRVL
jgi:hypothetical protein